MIEKRLTRAVDLLSIKKKAKETLRTVAYHTVFKPPYIKYCSQTIYQSLLGCIRLWEATNEEKWKLGSKKMLNLLISIQRPDGGFDIGYDFNFGELHKTGESTSPELVGLVAFAKYEQCFKDGKAAESAKKAAQWIKQHSVKLEEGLWTIPYGPYSTKEIMVYNGVSFAAGALGCYLGTFSNTEEELEDIYKGMNKYLLAVLSASEERPGKFWYYSDQARTDLNSRVKTKIDYYHQMQQVEMHALAQQVCNCHDQLEIIEQASDYIADLCEGVKVIPYTNDSFFFRGKIHIWGLSSIIPGMLEAAIIFPDNKVAYHKVAKKTLDWILANSWNGKFFYPVLEQNGEVVRPTEQMVRSDAWVFNAFAAYTKYVDKQYLDVADTCFDLMERRDFSGPESHATTNLSRAFSKMIKAMRR